MARMRSVVTRVDSGDTSAADEMAILGWRVGVLVWGRMRVTGWVWELETINARSVRGLGGGGCLIAASDIA